MKTSRDFFLVSFVRLCFVFLITETIFRLFSFPSLFSESFFRAEVFLISTACFFSLAASFLPVKAGSFLIGFISWFFAFYAAAQLQFMNFYGSYMSVKASFDGAGRISQFAGQFISLIRPEYLTVFIAPLICSILMKKIPLDQTSRLRSLRISLAVCLCMESIGTASVASSGNMRLYSNPQFINVAMREFGLGRFLLLDLLSIGSREHVALLSEEPLSPSSSETPAVSESPLTSPSASPSSQPARSRRDDIDDTEWKKLMDQEKNEDIRTIDGYLMNRTISDYNDHTGMFQDFNVVYIMIEAFDYMAIDKELTPTLYKMKEEGWDFTHHYTPKFSCATGESEFVSEVSLIPQSDLCTPNQYAENDWQNSIFQLFEHDGYYTSAYHNWKDEFYERRTLYSHSGCEAYLNFEDLQYNQLWGWQSDLEMMELTIPYWIDKDRFFSLYVTSSTHFPYDQGSDLGNRYLEEISALHPDYPIEVQRYLSKAMELDKAMEYLIDQLKKAGKFDRTLIVLYADHHPLETELSVLNTYGGYEADRLDGLNEDRTPMIFYSGAIHPEKLNRVNSTFDILPTVANLLGIHYDPRIYIGTDYFSSSPLTVIFPNGSWITEEGSYHISDDSFEGNLPRSEIDRKNHEISNLFNISRMIYHTDYFRFRPDIPFPKKSTVLVQ